MTDESPSSICRGCGNCCDGTLFGKTLRAGDSIHSLVQLSLPPLIDSAGDCVGFAQPCPAFSEGLCSVYDLRPTACRSFHCHLLKETERGAIPVVAAREAVRRSRDLRSQVLPELDNMLRDAGATYAGHDVVNRLAALLDVVMQLGAGCVTAKASTPISAGKWTFVWTRRRRSARV